MTNKLYLLEKEKKNTGEYFEPLLVTEDELLEFAKTYDNNIDKSTLLDAMTTTFEYEVTEITKLDDLIEIFENLKCRYMNF